MNVKFSTRNLLLVFGILSGFTASAQTTLPRPWFEGFQATGGVPTSLLTTGTWEAGEDPGFPGNPGAFLMTAHWPTASLPANSSVQTPNISGILATDTFSFDYVHNSGFPTPGPSSVGAAYLKVFISTNSGTTYTQIDSVMSSTNATWQPKKYPLAAYAGQTVRFKIESNALVTSTLQALRIDNFKVDGAQTSTPCTPPVVDLGPDTVLCNGSSLTLDAGNTGATFEWNNNSTAQTLNVTTAGTYWVTVTTGPNCFATDTIEVLNDTVPTITGADIVVNCNTNVCTLSVVNPEPDVVYFWQFCDGNTTTGSVVYFSPTTSDTCLGTLIVENTCGADSTEFTLINNTVGIKHQRLAASIQVFPNPAQDLIRIQNNSKQRMSAVKILDLTGRVVLVHNPTKQQLASIDLSSLHNGSYILVIDTDAGIITKNFSLIR
jgi:hypothetical protein